MSAKSLGIIGLVIAASGAGAACSASSQTNGFVGEGAGAGASAAGGSESSTGEIDPTTGSGIPADECDAGPDEDRDADGWTRAGGDCNDCDRNANPGAIEVVGAEGDALADEDCDGAIDVLPPPCDASLDIADPDPRRAARAIDVCRSGDDGGYGLVSAAYVRANGASYAGQGLQHGILEGFGPNVQPQLGERLLVLSSGRGRAAGQPGACADMSCYTSAVGAPPPGFPADVPGCDGGTTVHDDVGLELTLRAPTNATGYRFGFKFYSFEFAEWVCTEFNDQFIALVAPPPMGSENGNIVFDSKKNPVSVNIAFFDVCDAGANGDFAAECELLGNPGCPQKPSPYCQSGSAELEGTGFDDTFGAGIEDGGATSWLETKAPIEGGDQVTIRFAIWDTGDDNLDSTVLVDGFEWIASGGVEVGTDPIPDPK